MSLHARCVNWNTRYAPTRHGEVYLIRGLANVFSLGMDQMGKEFTKLGMENCVFNHRLWSGIANDVIERSYGNAVNYPIIIIGHSLGAGVAPKMATRLGQFDIPVAYVAMFDPVEPTQIGAKVDEIINWYIYKSDKDKILRPMANFTGQLDNVDLASRPEFDHFNIDKSPELQGIIFARALDLSAAAQQAEGAEE